MGQAQIKGKETMTDHDTLQADQEPAEGWAGTGSVQGYINADTKGEKR